MKIVTTGILSLLIALTLSVHVFAATVSVDIGGGQTQSVTGESNSSEARAVYTIVNTERRNAGLNALTWSSSLSSAAVLRTFENAVAMDASHTRPNGKAWHTVSSLANGENIAKGQADAASVMQAWMDSPGHKDNILDPKFNSIAVGCVEVDGTMYWTQLFSQSGGSGTASEADTVTQDGYFTVSFVTYEGSDVDSQQIESGGRVSKPADPTKAGQKFLGWYKDSKFATVFNFNTTKITKKTSIYAKWSDSVVQDDTQDTTSTTSTTTTTTTAKPAATTGEVKSDTIVKDAGKALATATTKVAYVTVKNAEYIAPKTLVTLASTASKSGKTLTVNADTTTESGKTVQGRIYVEPAKLTGLKNNLKLSVYTDASKTDSTKANFEKWYKNEIAVVRMEQTGSLGAKLQVAAKVDVSKLNTKNLVFYSYNKTANTREKLTATNYTVSKTGYVNFWTDKGGYIIITDKDLAK